MDGAMSEMIKDLFPHFFQGVNLVIASIALVLIGAYSWWIFAKKTERKKAKTLVWPCIIVVLLAGIAMFVNDWLKKSAETFPNGTTGVLVLRIVGDDGSRSFQRDLVNSCEKNFNIQPLAFSLLNPHKPIP
jgi:amino acid permease